MLNSIVGLLGNGVVAGDYQSIATVSVTGATSASIVFSSIPATYSHLQIRGIARGDSTNYMDVWMNGDTTQSKYAYHYLRGDGTSASSGGSAASTRPFGGFTTTTSDTSGMFGATIIDLLDYTNTNKYKTLRSLAGADRNTTGGNIFFFSSLFMDTSAISSVTLQMQSGNFVQYSTFALYGIKG